jgi:uncharacterized OsmC-like protein
MKTTLRTTSNELQFEVSNEYTSIEVGANQSNTEDEKTFRPMELLLASISSCSAIDILNILKKQRQKVVDFVIITNGTRKDATPSTFENIELNILIKGNIDELKLIKAIELTKEKYCSVYHILSKSATINYTFKIEKS